MNAFREHHEDSIRFGYRCFDRVLLNGLVCVVFSSSSSASTHRLPQGSCRLSTDGDARVQDAKRHQLDRLYQRVVDDLDRLLAAVGLKIAA